MTTRSTTRTAGATTSKLASLAVGAATAVLASLTLAAPGTAAAAPADVGDPSGATAYVTSGKPGPRAAASTMADEPTLQELMDKCDRKELDSCEFKPSGAESINRGENKIAGGGQNCTSGVSSGREIWWASTEGETNSLGVTLSAKGGLKDVFEVGIETSYGHEWTWTKTQTDKVTVDLQPGQAVNVFVAADRSTVRGTYEMRFGDPYYGHYYWYINDVEVSAPTHNTAWFSTVSDTASSC